MSVTKYYNKSKLLGALSTTFWAGLVWACLGIAIMYALVATIYALVTLGGIEAEERSKEVWVELEDGTQCVIYRYGTHSGLAGMSCRWEDL